jgi:hypothetical protein
MFRRSTSPLYASNCGLLLGLCFDSEDEPSGFIAKETRLLKNNTYLFMGVKTAGHFSCNNKWLPPRSGRLWSEESPSAGVYCSRCHRPGALEAERLIYRSPNSRNTQPAAVHRALSQPCNRLCSHM